MKTKKAAQLDESSKKLLLPVPVDPEIAKMNARITLSTYSSTALIADAYKSLKNVDVKELQSEMGDECRKIRDGNLLRVGSMLIAQAHSLDVIFTNLALNASVNLHSNLGAAETYLRLALKAQSQCRATLETLAEIKNPPIFAKQANISHGHQQVNNGVVTEVPSAGEKKSQQNELLEHQHGERLDARAAGKASGSNQAVAAVETVHGAADERGKATRKPQRMERGTATRATKGVEVFARSAASTE